jgi:hypothetical protein
MRLQREAERRQHGGRVPGARPRPTLTPRGGEQVGDAGRGHQRVALAEIIAGGEGHQPRQHVEQHALDRPLGGAVAHPQRQPPQREAEHEQAELQRRHRADPGQPRQFRRDQVQHEDQRRVHVDQIGIEPLAAEPALAEGEDRRDIVVDRRRQHDRHEQQRRQRRPQRGETPVMRHDGYAI